MDDRPTLDYATPTTDRRRRREYQWTRPTLLAAATLATLGVTVPTLASMNESLDRKVGVALALAYLFGLAFWPGFALLSLIDGWRPSSVLSRGTARYCVALSAIEYAFAGPSTRAAFILAPSLLVAWTLLNLDLARARLVRPALSFAAMAASVIASLPASRCPHATQVYFAGVSIVVIGTPCRNSQTPRPWWWTLYRYP